MGEYKEIKGDLIELTKRGNFDLISHGCNCQNMQGAGIALLMNENFNTGSFPMESRRYKGDYNKLGTIDFQTVNYTNGLAYSPSNVMGKSSETSVIVVNSYTQFYGGRNLDYNALIMCLRKINFEFKGYHIGLPKIGAGIAGGDWNIISAVIRKELKDMKVTIVVYDK